MLQANTMLMYPLQEAIDLLTGKLEAAKKSLEDAIEDLEFLREQATVMEVNFARVHNVRLTRSLLCHLSLPVAPSGGCLEADALLQYSGMSSGVFLFASRKGWS
jgi:hypothetical protein